MRIKNNQAILNAPFGSILLTFADGDLIKCELSEAAVEEDLGSFVGHKAVKALQSYLKGDIHVLMIAGSPVKTARNFAVGCGRKSLRLEPVTP